MKEYRLAIWIMTPDQKQAEMLVSSYLQSGAEDQTNLLFRIETDSAGCEGALKDLREGAALLIDENWFSQNILRHRFQKIAVLTDDSGDARESEDSRVIYIWKKHPPKDIWEQIFTEKKNDGERNGRTCCKTESKGNSDCSAYGLNAVVFFSPFDRETAGRMLLGAAAYLRDQRFSDRMPVVLFDASPFSELDLYDEASRNLQSGHWNCLYPENNKEAERKLSPGLYLCRRDTRPFFAKGLPADWVLRAFDQEKRSVGENGVILILASSDWSSENAALFSMADQIVIPKFPGSFWRRWMEIFFENLDPTMLSRIHFWKTDLAHTVTENHEDNEKMSGGKDFAALCRLLFEGKGNSNSD